MLLCAHTAPTMQFLSPVACQVSYHAARSCHCGGPLCSAFASDTRTTARIASGTDEHGKPGRSNAVALLSQMHVHYTPCIVIAKPSCRQQCCDGRPRSGMSGIASPQPREATRCKLRLGRPLPWLQRDAGGAGAELPEAVERAHSHDRLVYYSAERFHFLRRRGKHVAVRLGSHNDLWRCVAVHRGACSTLAAPLIWID